MRHVCLIGTGRAALAHAEALRQVGGVALHAVVDSTPATAKEFAHAWRVPRLFTSAEDAVRSGEVDCAHVLTPPDHHAEGALPFLEAGLPCLVEAPLAGDVGQCGALLETAIRCKAELGVNLPFLHHPAFLRLRRQVERRRLGPPRFVSVIAHLPHPSNPADTPLDQAIHPLAQIASLTGRLEVITATADPPAEGAAPGKSHAALSLGLAGQALPAQLHLALGQNFPFWQVTILCDDGVLVADITHNRLAVHRGTGRSEPMESLANGWRMAAATLSDSLANALRVTFAPSHRGAKGDPVALCTQDSIAAFHTALDDRRPPESDAGFAAHLVAVYEQAEALAGRHHRRRPSKTAAAIGVGNP